MAAYNAAKTIEAAIDSIRQQTFHKWRLLAVDDGSTDNTAECCEAYVQKDPRIRLIRSRHQGLCETLNRGLSLIDTKYVARLDADDIAYPPRLEKQMTMLQANAAIKVIGTRGHRLSAAGQVITTLGSGPATVEEYREAVRKRDLFFILSSSVIACTRTLIEYGGYRARDYPAEDTALHTRIAQDHVVLTLPEPLVGYRMSAGGITARAAWKQMVQIKRLDYNIEHDSDLDYPAFLKLLDREPLRKLRVWWCCAHKCAVRNGIGYWSDGRRALGATFMLAGGLLLPAEAVRRVVKRY